ncbi:MAG TPA: site-2 protease family protein [Acidimicrobiales bacterium]|nr:site-2 protease family protein [Acidimicrobiales bacterium]
MTRAQQTAILVIGGLALAVLAHRNGMLSSQAIWFFAALIPAVILHEVSHGVAALAFGDDTAKQAGRLTLNPIAHIDPVWTILIPAMLALSGAPVLGMAKPVPVNPRRMRHPRNQGLLTSLAGPATNVLLAALAAVVMRNGLVPAGNALRFVNAFGVVNVVLAVFNMLPIPPLDGSAVLERFLPAHLLPGYLRIRQYSFVIFFVLFFLAGGLFTRILDPAVTFWYRFV